jgi:hypothetical protein
MKPAVCIGPSGYGINLSRFEHIDFVPPARCGDLINLVRSGRTRIGLIDGVFETVPTVMHKEILYAMSKGVTVYGAASIGALRAAECCSFGMIGVGQIFESYADRSRSSDADVAVLHGPREVGFLPLTVPLVDAEFALKMLLDAEAIQQEECDLALRAARSLFYKDRDWTSVFTLAGFSNDEVQRLIQDVSRLGHLEKAKDVLALVALISRNESFESARHSKFQPTLHFDQLMKICVKDHHA